MSPRRSTSKKLVPSARDRNIYYAVAVRGRSRAEVAREYQLSGRRIREIVRETQHWLAAEQLKQDANLLRYMHIQRLEHQWHELMLAWYRSVQSAETTRVSTEESTGGKSAAPARRKAEKTQRPQYGDVRYLEQARRVLAEIRRISGADGPLQLEGDEPIDASELKKLSRLADAERMDVFVEITQSICNTVAATTSEATAGGHLESIPLFQD